MARTSAVTTSLTGAVSPSSRAAGGIAPLITSISRRPSGHDVEEHRGPGARDLLAERAHVGNRVVEVERDAAGPCDGVRLGAAGGGHLPGGRVVEHLADGALEHRTRAAEGDVADQLLPHEPLDVVVRLDAEACVGPHLGDPVDPRRGGPVPLPEPHELPAVVVDVPGSDDRGSEAAGDSDRDRLVTEHGRDPVGAPEAVLDRQDDGVGPDQRRRVSRGGLDVPRLGRDHDELADADLGRVGGRVDADRALPAGALDGQPVRVDRVDVLRPDVERPDLVPGVAEDPGVHRAHRPGADDRDLHEATSRTAVAPRLLPAARTGAQSCRPARLERRAHGARQGAVKIEPEGVDRASRAARVRDAARTTGPWQTSSSRSSWSRSSSSRRCS